MTTMKIEGFKELEKELEQLSKAMGRGVLRRALMKAAKPMAERMEQLAPRDEGTLAESITASTKLTKRQQRKHRRMFKDERASVEVFVGAGGLTQAITQEFGTPHHAPQPFVRPAWDAESKPTLERLKGEIRQELDKTIARTARRAARQKIKG